MDLFNSVISTQASPQLTSMLLNNQQQVWSSLSDSTRATLTESSSMIATINPHATLEQIERAKVMVGTVFNQAQLELLTNVYALQTSNEHTALTTLAHPAIATMHRLGQTDAYGIEYNALRNNLLFNRISSGFGGLDGTDNYAVTNYADNYTGEDMEPYNSLSLFGKQTIHRNWNATIATAFNEGVDFGSVHSGTF